jgi:hypothetical protein
MRFVFDERFFTAVVRKPSTTLVYIESIIFPQYSVFSFQPNGESVDANPLMASCAAPDLDSRGAVDAFENYFVLGRPSL